MATSYDNIVDALKNPVRTVSKTVEAVVQPITPLPEAGGFGVQSNPFVPQQEKQAVIVAETPPVNVKAAPSPVVNKATPPPVEQKATPPSVVATPVVEKAPDEVTIAPPSLAEKAKPALTPYEEWNLSHPDGTAYEYAFEQMYPKPRYIDPKKQARDRKLSSLYDLAGLLAEGIGVARGGNAIDRKDGSATKMVDDEYKRLMELYRQDKDKYNAAHTQAILSGLADRSKNRQFDRSLTVEREKIQQAREESQAKVKQYEDYYRDKLIEDRRWHDLQFKGDKENTKTKAGATLGAAALQADARKYATVTSDVAKTTNNYADFVRALAVEQTRKELPVKIPTEAEYNAMTGKGGKTETEKPKPAPTGEGTFNKSAGKKSNGKHF